MIDDLSFFKYRDSISEQMNEAYAIKQFYGIRQNLNPGAVAVRLDGCDNLPFYKAERYIKNTGRLLANMTKTEACRVRNCDFVIFAQNWEDEAKRIMFYLKRLSDENKSYSVAAVKIKSKNEEFSDFLENVNRELFKARNEKVKKGIY